MGWVNLSPLDHRDPHITSAWMGGASKFQRCSPIKIRGAFTLIELLVVIAVIASIACLGLGSISVAMKIAKASKCANAQRQLTLGALSYALDQEDGLPATQVYKGATRYMWYELISDYVADGKSSSTLYKGSVIAGCPEWQYDSGNSTSFSYGINAFLALKDGLVNDDFGHNRWGGSSIQANWREFKLSNVSKQSMRLYFADTRAFWTGNLDLPSTNTFETRHLGKIVVVFLDGRSSRTTLTNAIASVKSP